MGVRDWLTRIVRKFGGDERTAEGVTAPNDDDATIPDEADANVAVTYDPDEIERQVDTLIELGLEPEELVQRLLKGTNGRLRQQSFTDYTDWSEATVSRVLSEMEADGEIIRTKIGNEKVVCLPEAMPDPTSSQSADHSDDPKVI